MGNAGVELLESTNELDAKLGAPAESVGEDQPNLRRIQMEGHEEELLMDEEGNIYDLQGNYVGTLNDDGEEEGLMRGDDAEEEEEDYGEGEFDDDEMEF